MTHAAKIARLERWFPAGRQVPAQLAPTRLLLKGEAAAAVLAFYRKRGEDQQDSGPLATVRFEARTA